MTTFVHLFMRSVIQKYHNDIKYHVTLNIIFSVVSELTQGSELTNMALILLNLLSA
jgi:hypothetical protein